MKLPNIDFLRVDEEKLTEYLLCESHSEGAGKAGFFKRFGYTRALWMAFRDALCQHARNHEVHKVVESKYGVRYIIRCNIPVLEGVAPCICTVWIVERNSDVPRLVTAYPSK